MWPSYIHSIYPRVCTVGLQDCTYVSHLHDFLPLLRWHVFSSLLKLGNQELQKGQGISKSWSARYKITNFMANGELHLWVLTLSRRSSIVFPSQLSTLAIAAFIFFNVDFCVGVNPGSTSIYHDRSNCKLPLPYLEEDILCTWACPTPPLIHVPFVAQVASAAVPGSSCVAPASSWSFLHFSVAGEAGLSERDAMNLWLCWRSLTSVMVRRPVAWLQRWWWWWWWWYGERRWEGWKDACLTLQPLMSVYGLMSRQERLTLSSSP